MCTECGPRVFSTIIAKVMIAIELGNGIERWKSAGLHHVTIAVARSIGTTIVLTYTNRMPPRHLLCFDSGVPLPTYLVPTYLGR